MSEIWTKKLRSDIFSRIVSEFSIKVNKKNLTRENFSTKGNSTTSPVFPFVYVQELESARIGKTLRGNSLSGLRYSLQIDVTDNKDEGNARDVMYEIQRILMGMGFDCNSPFPDYSQTNAGVYRYIMRCSRPICHGDIY